MEVAATTQYFHNVKTSTRSLIYLLSVWSVSSFLATSSNDKVNIKNSDKSFFADVNNPVNQYMVKYAWGWTFYPLCLLFTVTSFTQSVRFLVHCLSKLSANTILYITGQITQWKEYFILGQINSEYWSLVFLCSLPVSHHSATDRSV